MNKRPSEKSKGGVPKRPLYIIGTVSVLVVNVAFLWYMTFRRGEFAADLPKLRLTNPDFAETEKRIAEDVSKLKRESIEDTLKNLSLAKMYFWPGPVGEDGIFSNAFPLASSFGERDVEHILSNRRVIKACAELSKLPKKQAADAINHSIDESLILYDSLLRQSLQENPELEPAADGITVGIVFVIGDPEDGSPTLIGTRFKLLSLVYLAGNLQLSESADSVIKMVNKAKEQYAEWSHTTEHSVEYAHIMAKQAGLYSRQALAIGLIGTSSVEIKLPQSIQEKMSTQDMPRYNALSTPYDQHVLIGVVDVDFGKAPLTLKKIGSLTDEEFDQIVTLCAD